MTGACFGGGRDGMNPEPSADFLKSRYGCCHELNIFLLELQSGEGGIRTHGGVSPTPVFETGLFNQLKHLSVLANDPLFYGTSPHVPQ